MIILQGTGAFYKELFMCLSENTQYLSLRGVFYRSLFFRLAIPRSNSGDCFVAKNAPRNDKKDCFRTDTIYIAYMLADSGLVNSQCF
jgi:hypothetical protein